MRITELTQRGDVQDLIRWRNSLGLPTVIDLETTGLCPRRDKILDVAMTGEDQDSVVVCPFFPYLMGTITTPLIFHNQMFDLAMLQASRVTYPVLQSRDTMLIHHLLSEIPGTHGLDSLIQEYFKSDYKAQFWAKHKDYQSAPRAEQVAYAGADAYYTLKLYEIFQAELRAQSIPDSLVEHVHRLAHSLMQTEIRGIAVDLEYLTQKGVELQAEIADLQPRLRELGGPGVEAIEMRLWTKEMDKRKTDKGKAAVPRPTFSFDSPVQLNTLLYSHLGLPVQYDQKTRRPTTGDSALEALERAHPLIQPLREYRGHQKVYGAYIEGTLERLEDGRIYPSFNPNGTKTGRISHSGPNLGQLPSTGGIRGIYVPEPGFKLISADYSQLEVCIEANFTRDANLTAIFTKGLSKHDITAKELGLPRSTAKTLNFGLQYWCGPRKVAQIVGVSLAEGQVIYDRYWQIYNGVKALKEQTDRMVDTGTPVVTPFGRKRRLGPDFEEKWLKEKAQRQAYNFLIQGTGADITNRAFYLMAERLQRNGHGRALWSVHAEILIEVGDLFVEEEREALIHIMTSIGSEISLEIPLKVDCSEGMERWLD